MYLVYEQQKPIPTGMKFQTRDHFGNLRTDEWHTPNLVCIGEASNMEEARQLTRYPILGSKTASE